MSERTIIELIGVNIYQQDKLILNNISLSISKGEFAYLIGRTGSGKTSLLKTLYGILPLKKGEGTVAGFDLMSLDRKTIPFLRRKVGFVFQDFVLLKDRSVNDNLRFALEATGWTDEAAIQAKMKEALSLVGVSHLANQRPHALSGGEQQRVVIARAILNSPKLIIADEATGNLDPETSEEILNLLIDLSKNYNTSVLFATHDYNLLKQYPFRIIKCEDGRLYDEVESVL